MSLQKLKLIFIIDLIKKFFITAYQLPNTLVGFVLKIKKTSYRDDKENEEE